MARKKKRVVRRKSVRARPSASFKKVGFSRVKLGVVARNLILFVLLSLISYILYLVSNPNGAWVDIFYFLLIIFGFISVAFLISLLVLLLMKWIKK